MQRKLNVWSTFNLYMHMGASNSTWSVQKIRKLRSTFPLFKVLSIYNNIMHLVRPNFFIPCFIVYKSSLVYDSLLGPEYSETMSPTIHGTGRPNVTHYARERVSSSETKDASGG